MSGEGIGLLVGWAEILPYLGENVSAKQARAWIAKFDLPITYRGRTPTATKEALKTWAEGRRGHERARKGTKGHERALAPHEKAR